MKSKTMTLACTLALAATFLQSIPASAQTAVASPRVRLAESIKVIQDETTATRDQLKATVEALNALTKQEKGDLLPTYDNYVAQVKKTHEASDTTASRISAMQTASKDYFDAWQAEIAGINNQALRDQAQKRMDNVVKKYNEVIASFTEASDKFKPFLSNLDDVQKMLANDTTPGGVKAIRGVASDANWYMKKVNSSLNDAIEELGEMAKSLSSKTD